MKSKKLVGALGVMFLLVTLHYSSGKQVFTRVFASTDLNVRPYVMEKIHFIVSEGKEIVTAKVIESRRRDGATHESHTYFNHDGTVAQEGRRFELPDGYTGMVMDSIRSKSTIRIPDAEAASKKTDLMNPPPQCARPGEIVEGEESLFGNQTMRIVQQAKSDSLERNVTWRMPNFNCVTVQTWLQKRAEPMGEWKTYQGIRFSAFAEADPDPRIFVDWRGYEELKPSDLKRKLLRKNGVTPEQCPQCFEDDPSDKKYLESRR